MPERSTNKITDQEKDPNMFAVTENVICQVSLYKEKKRVDIRKWWYNKDIGKFLRSKNGLNIELDDWNDFVARISDLDLFVQERASEL